MWRNRPLRMGVISLLIASALLCGLFWYAYAKGAARAYLPLFIGCVIFLIACFAIVLSCLVPVYLSMRRMTRITSVLARGGTVRVEEKEGDAGALLSGILSMNRRIQYSLEDVERDRQKMQTLLYDISHQLKTPIAALFMYNDLMRTRTLSPEKNQELLDLCDGQLNRINWLVQGLLKLAQVEYGAVTMHKKDGALWDTLEQSIAPLTPFAQERGVQIQVRVDQAMRFPHDSAWVAEAFTNILRNALEHTPAGGAVTISASATPLTVEVRIRDTGEGIAEKDLPHIFERFYRGDANRSESVGIGLALAKRIIEQNNGDIYVKSETGFGSEFIVTFIL